MSGRFVKPHCPRRCPRATARIVGAIVQERSPIKLTEDRPVSVYLVDERLDLRFAKNLAEQPSRVAGVFGAAGWVDRDLVDETGQRAVDRGGDTEAAGSGDNRAVEP